MPGQKTPSYVIPASPGGVYREDHAALVARALKNAQSDEVPQVHFGSWREPFITMTDIPQAA